VPLESIDKNCATIEGSDVNYLKNVLRLSVGSEIRVLDNKSKEYQAKIVSFEDSKVIAELLSEKHPKAEPKVKVTVAHGIAKGYKMDFVVQKTTELGALRIIPVKTERTVVKIHHEKEEHKVERWQKIAKEAAEQSGRLIIPMVEQIMEFRDIFSLKKEFDLCVMLWEMEKEVSIKQLLQSHKDIKRMMILIGPEGGFSHEEAETAKCEGFVTANIGSRILRTETAAIAALSMINYEYEM
jgi:16S rRNA (uracil1498-N3)-methyltransferase